MPKKFPHRALWPNQRLKRETFVGQVFDVGGREGEE